MLVALSITGRYEPIIHATVVADQYGAHTIAVTAPDSPLSLVTSDVVPFLIGEPENILAPTPARYVLLALLDILAYEVATIRGEALQQLAQHLALGLDEPLMEFTFHALEDFIAKRPGSKSIDVLAQPRERTLLIAP